LDNQAICKVLEGNEQSRSGRLLTDYIPVYNLGAAYTFNSDKYILPLGTVKNLCAAPDKNGLFQRLFGKRKTADD
jgi:hypothetical protein